MIDGVRDQNYCCHERSFRVTSYALAGCALIVGILALARISVFSQIGVTGIALIGGSGIIACLPHIIEGIKKSDTQQKKLPSFDEFLAQHPKLQEWLKNKGTVYFRSEYATKQLTAPPSIYENATVGICRAIFNDTIEVVGGAPHLEHSLKMIFKKNINDDDSTAIIFEKRLKRTA